MIADRSVRYDVGVIGGLVGFDLVLAEALASRGYRCSVLVPQREMERRRFHSPAGVAAAWDPSGIVIGRSSVDVLRWTRRCALVVSLTGSLAFAFRYLWPVVWALGRRSHSPLGIPPIMGFATGSDLAELAVARTRRGAVLRGYLRWVDVNWVSPYPYAIRNAAELGLKPVFMDFPYDLRYASAHPAPPPRGTGRLRLVHPSHFDFGVNDPGTHRRSTKGNDRFIRALGRAVAAGLDVECLMLDRGPDRAEARALVEADSRLTDRVRWSETLPRERLYEEMTRADVVVDQFDVGGLGGIAIEAMALGRPVITYVDPASARLQYGHDLPPVRNCRSEDDIFDALMACRDRAALARTAERSRAWAIRHHRWDRCLDRFDYYFAALTGRPWPAMPASL